MFLYISQADLHYITQADLKFSAILFPSLPSAAGNTSVCHHGHWTFYDYEKLVDIKLT